MPSRRVEAFVYGRAGTCRRVDQPDSRRLRCRAELYALTQIAAHMLGTISMVADSGKAMKANVFADSTAAPGQAWAERDMFESSTCGWKSQFGKQNWWSTRWTLTRRSTSLTSRRRVFQPESPRFPWGNLAFLERAVDQI